MSEELPKRTWWRQEGETVVIWMRVHPLGPVLCTAVGLGFAVLPWVMSNGGGQTGMRMAFSAFGGVFGLLGFTSLFTRVELRRGPDRLFAGSVVGSLRLGRSVATADIRKVERVEHIDKASGKHQYTLLYIFAGGRTIKFGAGLSKAQVDLLWRTLEPGFRSGHRLEYVERSSD